MAEQNDDDPVGGTATGTGSSSWWVTTAGLSASVACTLLFIYLWTDPSSKLLLTASGVCSLASAALSFSVLRVTSRAALPVGHRRTGTERSKG